MNSVKLVLANQTNKQALDEWEEFISSIRDSTPIDNNETEEGKAARIRELEKPGNEEEWFRYYFPRFFFCEPADFQKRSTRIALNTKRLYQTRAWFRGSAKTTRRMFEKLYKKLVQKKRVNLLLISKTEDNAIRLLSTYKGNLEANQRLLNDYGVQRSYGKKWTEYEFITRDKSSFRAVGMEQNPRGAKLDELRITDIIFDDADDDEVCRNPDRLNAQWNWVEEAVIPTVDISADYCICFDNNIISEDSLAARAAKKATHPEIVNIRDKNGKSSWPQKNSEADINFMLSIISYESGQKEYFNNPISSGKSFPEVKFGKCPHLKYLRFVIGYADPATSSKDKPTLKSNQNNSCKAYVIIGYKDFTYYVYKAYVDHTSQSNFIEWLYNGRDYVGVKTHLKPYIENNNLQDGFYQMALKPLIREKGRELKKPIISMLPDARDRGDKWTRIEATLEPLNRNGQLIFNIEEMEDPHMKRLIAQLKGAKATSKILDGPDALEGAVSLMKDQIALMIAGKQLETIEGDFNAHRY
jgi:hypothetical protein